MSADINDGDVRGDEIFGGGFATNDRDAVNGG